jgi:hypothetical protein
MSIVIPPGLVKLAKISKAQLQPAAVKALTTAVPAGAGGQAKGRMSGFGPVQAKAAGGISYTKLSDGFSLGGSGVLLAGSEYGGQRRPKQTYVIHRRGARPYTVRRRTTMQFHPYLGKTGYAITPTLRERMSGIRQKITKAVMEAVTHG